MDVDVRILTADDVDAAWRLAQDAFHAPEGDATRWKRSARPERMHGAFVDDRLVALCRSHAFGQFFGGRPVPMAGLASVVVEHEQRGRGYASAVVRHALDAMRARGEAISSLMPATTRLYRGLGWEVAGVHGAQRIGTRNLSLLPAGDAAPIRRATLDDLAAIQSCYGAVAAERDGMLDRPDWWWDHTITSRMPGMAISVVDGDDGDAVDGYAVWERTDAAEGHGITVHEVVARRSDAAIALWRLFGGTASQVREVEYFAPPEDPLFLLLPEQDQRPSWYLRWMLRIVDLPLAVAARGWRPGVRVEVDLDVRDRHAPWNDGRWRLHVDDGVASIDKGGIGSVHVSINALAAMYSGYASATSLARLGLVSGASTRELGALDALLAGPTPWLQDFF